MSKDVFEQGPGTASERLGDETRGQPQTPHSFRSVERFVTWAEDCPIAALETFLQQHPEWGRKTGRDGLNALVYMVRWDEIQRFQLLLPFSDAQTVFPDGSTVFMQAALCGKGEEKLRLLREVCTQAHRQLADVRGRTALFWAVSGRANPACIEALLEETEDMALSHQDVDGDTVLTLAAWNRQLVLLDLLLARCGASVCQLKNKKGLDALMVAAGVSHGYEDLPAFKRLLQKSNLSHQCMDHGQTALMRALTLLKSSLGVPPQLAQLLAEQCSEQQLELKSHDGQDAFALAMDLQWQHAKVVDAFARVATEHQVQEAIRQFGTISMPKMAARSERRALEQVVRPDAMPRQEATAAASSRRGASVNSSSDGDSALPHWTQSLAQKEAASGFVFRAKKRL